MPEVVIILAVIGVFLTIFFFSNVHERHESNVLEKHERNIGGKHGKAA
jgi:Na+/melibiose symporter-like transporter